LEVGPASGQISDQGGDASLPDCDLNKTQTFRAEGKTQAPQSDVEARRFQKQKKLKEFQILRASGLELC